MPLVLCFQAVQSPEGLLGLDAGQNLSARCYIMHPVLSHILSAVEGEDGEVTALEAAG